MLEKSLSRKRNRNLNCTNALNKIAKMFLFLNTQKWRVNNNLPPAGISSVESDGANYKEKITNLYKP